MHGFALDHSEFSFDVRLARHLSHVPQDRLLIATADLTTLHARVATGSAERVRYRLTKIRKTPHTLYVSGRKEPYRRYLKRFGETVGFGIEHSSENFDQLITSGEGYLEGRYSNEYIVCEEVSTIIGRRLVILDGFHRAAILLSQGVRDVPVALVLPAPRDPLAQLDQYLTDYRDTFLEWYTPIEIKGRVIHERTYPTFRERPEFLTNAERGQSRWDYIIERNLPSLHGKVVCDIGSNIGLYSILMIRRGAAHVTGYDRSADVIQPTNPALPRQSVVQQAYFVKNLFRLAGEESLENIDYVECDLATIDLSQVNCDLCFACCVLYHFGRSRFEEAISQISKNTPEIILQTNLGHRTDELSELVDVGYQRSLLVRNGYEVRLDMPPGYDYPVLYGSKATGRS